MSSKSKTNLNHQNNGNSSNNSNYNNAKNIVSANKEEISIALIGAPSVGKSAFMVKYITKRFIGEYDPIYGLIY